MSRTKMKNFILAVLMVAMLFVTTMPANALPDNPPTSTISANDYNPTTTTVITAVAVDTLTNPGVAEIRLYENGVLIDTKDCNNAVSCAMIKQVVKNYAGTYTYYAVSEDRSGQTMKSRDIVVTFTGAGQRPVIDSTSPSSPVSRSENDGVDLTVNAHDPEGGPLTYDWYVQGTGYDGTTPQSESSNTFHFQPTVAQDEDYIVNVQVKDQTGLMGLPMPVWDVTILNEVIGVDLTGTTDMTECEDGNYSVSVTTNNNIVRYTWDFGDGSAPYDGSDSETHTFPGDGSYDVTVTVEDSEGQTGSDTITVVVTDASPTVDIVGPTTLQLGELADFSADVVDSCYDGMVSYEWEWGDGSANVSGPTPVPASNPHMYTEENTYTVTLTVWDSDSFGQDTHVIDITHLGPDANFTWDPTSPVEGEEVNFTDESTPGQDPITSWEWDFDNDGIVDSQEQDPDHAFDQEGNYTVTLTVSDGTYSDSHTETITVDNNPPVIDFTAFPENGTEELDVDFDCGYVGGNEPVDVVIDFGDGGPLHQGTGPQSVTHTYTDDGQYQAHCVVTDNDGDVDDAWIDIEVYDSEPVIDFTWTPANPDEGDQIDFDATITAFDDPVTIDWDFGDGSAHPTSEDPSHTYDYDGSYNVTLTVEDSDGSVVSVTHTVVVANNPPDAELTVNPDPASGDEPLQVEYVCLVYDGNTPYNVMLDFGDGSTPVVVSPGDVVLHTYDQNGTYQAYCNVTDWDGDTDFDSELINVFDTAPDVSWNYTPTDPLEGEAVDFTSTISVYDTPYTIEWDFDDGTTSVDPNPTHVFDQDGQYTVTLTVTDADGSVVTIPGVIDVGIDAPDVTLDATPMQGPEGQQVDFDCYWTDGNAPFETVIDFGDGSPLEYNQSSVSHEYTTQGVYQATCTVTDTDGDFGDDSVVINIDNNVPNMTLDVNPQSGEEPLNVSAVCGVVDGNAPFDYVIDWGDGSPNLIGIDEAPTFGGSHEYTQDGIYTITCDVVDNDGDPASMSVDVEVTDSEPTASFVYTPLNPIEGDQVDFDATISGYDEPLTIQWDMGDGSIYNVEDPSHIYALEGDYNVTLTVTDSDGSQVVVWDVVSVGNNAPFVNLDGAPLVGPEGTNVTFDCNYVGGNSVVTVELDWDGDGLVDSSTTDQNLNDWHVFNIPGSYQATCTVTDADGDVDSDSVIVNIDNNPPIIDVFTANPNPTTEGQDVDFDCMVSGGDDPLVYELNYGDGTLPGTNPQETHAYTNEGNYTASCLVTDLDGDFSYEEVVVEVTNNPPIVNLVANNTNDLEPLSVHFDCTVGGGNPPMSYEIDFGDGTPVVNADNADHVYPVAGNFVATCTVSDVDGDVGSDDEQIVVVDNPPVINFVVTPTTGPEGTTVDFDCQTTGGNDPLVFTIDFGDGVQTNSAQAQHTYPLEGEYNASCYVVDNDGDSDLESQIVNITDFPPVVDVQLNVTSGLEPLDVDVFCSVGDGNPPFSYEIDLGDGSPLVTGTDTVTHTYAQPGHYDITCTVTDVDMDVDSDTETVVVIDNPPVITSWDATPNPTTEGQSVYFDCQTTGGNEPLNYVIDFGDGTQSASPQDFHTYTDEGLYNATCYVEDADTPTPDSDLEWLEVNVTNNPPIVSLQANVTSGLEPLDVEFTCLVGGGNIPYQYEIDFGDGSPVVTSDTATHTYAIPGLYDASCRVLDVDGDIGSDVTPITVIGNDPLIVSWDGIPNPATEGDTVDFDCQVVGGNDPLTYTIDFGDGVQSSNPQDSHQYDYEGLYNATCHVQDVDLDVDDAWFLVNVTNNAPVVDVVLNVTSGDEPLDVEVTCQVGGGNAPFSYEIDWDDGSPLVTGTDTATHQYATPGDYNVTCTVTDVDLDVGSDSEMVVVLDNPPVITSWDGTPNPATEGDTVDFDCQVTGGNTPLSYVINFGDGSPTTSNPQDSHTYTIEGLYNATCYVQDSDPMPDSDLEWVLVNVTNNPPIVDLQANVTSGDEPLDVEFTCVVGNGNTPYSYVIDFGDGSPLVNSDTATHQYTIPGVWDATCTVTDTDGDIASDLQPITVADDVPLVTLAAVPTIGPEGTTVDYDCQVVGGNAPLSYTILFGDGTSSNLAQVQHTYPLEGDYNASCTVTDLDLDTGSDWTWINISNNPPVTNLLENVTVGMEALDVEFNCTVGNGNAPFSYVIDFGDGSPQVTGTDYAVHQYAQDGDYLAWCQVTDTDGDVDTDYDWLNVSDSVPVALFNHSTPVVEGVAASFFDLSTSYDGIVSWEWDFDDDGVVDSTAQNPTFVYTYDGNYLATLNVTDADGSTASYSELVVVQNNAPVIELTVVPDEGDEPLSVTVTCSVTSGGNFPVTYNVLYGDGTSTTSPVSGYTYNDDGLYGVMCTVTDADGDVALDTVMVNVTDTVPTADFSFSPLLPGTGDTVSFTDLSTAYDGIVGWEWDFENDGVIDSTSQNPTHVYNIAGNYQVNLTVTDGDGSTAWVMKSIPVNATPGAPMILNVQVVDLTNVSANITWATDMLADSLVEWGLTPALGSSMSDGTLVYNHSMSLTGLVPDTLYYYNITSCNSLGNCTTNGPMNFTTLAADFVPPAPVTGLAESSVGTTWIDWSWTNPADADFDHVEVWVNGTFVANETGTNYNVTGLAGNTTYTVEIITVDAVGNRNTPGETDTATTDAAVGPDVTAPTVTLDSPADGSTDADGDVTVQYTVTDDIAANLNCDVWSDTSGVWALDASQVTANGASNTLAYLGLADGTYTWNVECDDGTNTAYAAANFTFDVNTAVVDVTPPTVTLTSPADTFEDNDGNVTVLYSVTDDMAANLDCDVWSNTSGVWALDAGQVTANGASNTFAYTGLADGWYEWNVECDDGTNTAFAAADFTFEVNTSGSSSGSVPSVVVMPDVSNGNSPLTVNFQAVVVGGDSPLTYDWDFDMDGLTDSTLQNPTWIYNSAGTYNATVTVCDVDLDCDTDGAVIIVGSAANRDVAVTSMVHNKTGTDTYLWDDVEVNATVLNEGDVTEVVAVDLLVDSVVVDTQIISVNPANTELVTFNWSNADPDGWRNLEVRANPVPGEVDLTDQSLIDNVRVWPVDVVASGNYVVSLATREIFLDETDVNVGDTFHAFLPIQNWMALEDFEDLRVDLEYDNTAFTLTGNPEVQLVDLPAGNLIVVVWTLQADGPAGNYAFSAALGNNEITSAGITAKAITVA